MTSTASIATAVPHQDARTASPHEMVRMLLDGALRRLGQAQDELAAGDSESLVMADRIIRALQESLDLAAGGELARNLYELYDYMLRRLNEAAAEGDPAGAAEAHSLLQIIQEGWEAIAPDVPTQRTRLAV